MNAQGPSTAPTIAAAAPAGSAYWPPSNSQPSKPHSAPKAATAEAYRDRNCATAHATSDGGSRDWTAQRVREDGRVEISRLLTIKNEQITVSEQAHTQPMAEVALTLVVASARICVEHSRHVLLAAAEGRILTPWVAELIDKEEIAPQDPVRAYTDWLRTLGIKWFAATEGAAVDFDHLMHGLAYVEAVSRNEPPHELASAGSRVEALAGALAVMAVTVRMQAEATAQTWNAACEELLGTAP